MDSRCATLSASSTHATAHMRLMAEVNHSPVNEGPTSFEAEGSATYLLLKWSSALAIRRRKSRNAHSLANPGHATERNPGTTIGRRSGEEQ